MEELKATITGMLPDATAAAVAMAVIGLTLGVIALVRRKN